MVVDAVDIPVLAAGSIVDGRGLAAALAFGAQGVWMGQGGLHYHNKLGRDEPDYDANNPIARGGQPVVETEYLTDALTREAVDFIDRHNDKPFFLYLAYNAVHSPLQGADAYMQKFSHIEDIHRRIFAAMLANLDDSVGAVMKQLRDSGLEENTIVFFLSDNGGPTRELTSSNLPLRGSKGTLYEGGVRVPFMVQWKGTIPPAQVYKKPVSSFDIYATAAANCEGVTAPQQIEAAADFGRERAAMGFQLLDDQLAKTEFIAGDKYTIADAVAHSTMDFATGLVAMTYDDSLVNLKRWHDMVSARPSAQA